MTGRIRPVTELTQNFTPARRARLAAKAAALCLRGDEPRELLQSGEIISVFARRSRHKSSRSASPLWQSMRSGTDIPRDVTFAAH